MRHGLADAPEPAGTPIATLAERLARERFVWFFADMHQLPADLTRATPAEEIEAQSLPAGLPREGWLARRRLARHVAAAASGKAHPGTIRIDSNAQGRPEFRVGATGWHLSLSARGAVALIAIADAPCGVDLEIEEPDLMIPSNILRGDERAWLGEQPEPLRVAAFCRIWTAKEAITKAMGVGFRIPPEDIALPAAGTSHVDIRKFGESAVGENENRLVHDLLVLTREGIRVFVTRSSGEERAAPICCTVALARGKETSRGGKAP